MDLGGSPFAPLINCGSDVERDPARGELSHHQSVQDHLRIHGSILKINLMMMIFLFLLHQDKTESNRWGGCETTLSDIEDENGDNQV